MELNYSSTHQMLASATKSRHDALDQQPLLRRLLSANLSLAEYARVMVLLRQCFGLIEPALVKHETLHLKHDVFPYNCKLPALDLDLLQLGVGNTQIPAAINSISINSAGGYLGARYVLEGSALGGAFIARHLEKALPELARKASNFWRIQKSAAERWSSFLLMLAQLDNDRQGRSQAIAGASETFDLFLSVFADGRGHPDRP